MARVLTPHVRGVVSQAITPGHQNSLVDPPEKASNGGLSALPVSPMAAVSPRVANRANQQWGKAVLANTGREGDSYAASAYFLWCATIVWQYWPLCPVTDPQQVCPGYQSA
uniref:Uncharacterized protein n=1 Tax=Eutreptiella gymnastica TaxID=73025 RepID=A0A7S4G843_9EUGL